MIDNPQKKEDICKAVLNHFYKKKGYRATQNYSMPLEVIKRCLYRLCKKESINPEDIIIILNIQK